MIIEMKINMYHESKYSLFLDVICTYNLEILKSVDMPNTLIEVPAGTDLYA